MAEGLFFADECAKFHECLVEVSCLSFWEVFCDECFYTLVGFWAFDGFVYIKESGKDSFDIAVYAVDILFKGDTGYGACGVGADSREGENIVKIFGEMALMIVCNDFCGFVNISGS